MELKEERDKKRKKIVIIVAAALVLAAGLFFFFYFRAQITATTMRVLRLEGDVSLEDKGKSKTVKENLRLNNDNALSTADESLVSIGLDDTKIVTMDELSRAEFSQQGRKLKLNLTAGSLFFDVTKPLDLYDTQTPPYNLSLTTLNKIHGSSGATGYVIYGVGGTDVRKSLNTANPTHYSYGNSSDRFSSIQDSYVGSDGNTYTKLSNSTTGSADVYINNTTGDVTITNDPL